MDKIYVVYRMNNCEQLDRIYGFFKEELDAAKYCVNMNNTHGLYLYYDVFKYTLADELVLDKEVKDKVIYHKYYLTFSKTKNMIYDIDCKECNKVLRPYESVSINKDEIIVTFTVTQEGMSETELKKIAVNIIKSWLERNPYDKYELEECGHNLSLIM